MTAHSLDDFCCTLRCLAWSDLAQTSYLQNLPREYPVRVLSAALAYRVWRTEGRLARSEKGDNAKLIQRIGIPGIDAVAERTG